MRIRHKTPPFSGLNATLLVSAIFLATMCLESRGDQMYSLPSHSAAVDKAVSAPNLETLASKTTDPDVLLGYAFLAPMGSPIRREISEMAVKGRPEYAPIVTILAVAMDGVDEHSVGELIKNDPNNALGYYLRADQLYQSGKEQESLPDFRKGAACSELRLYGTITANALFKALDALNLQGRNRLAALSWTATRMSNFYIGSLQSMRTDLGEMSVKADLATRREISDLLLVVGGQLFTTNFSNRQFAEWTVLDAVRLKSQIAAAEKSPTMNGYVAITNAMAMKRSSWSQSGEKSETPLEAAQFLPDRVWSALATADPSQKNSLMLMQANVPDSDKAAYEKAQKDFIKTATAIIDASLTDPDGIIGSYLKDLPPAQKDGANPLASSYSYVDVLIKKRPDVMKAVAANDQAMSVLQQTGNSDPSRRNVGKLMRVGMAIWSYACNHDQNLPASLEVLYKDGKYLSDASEAQSLLTGKSYVYAAAPGATMPEKQAELGRYILVYDGDEVDGCYQCAMGDGGGANLPPTVFQELIRKQAK